MFNSCVNFLEKQVAKNGEKIAITDKNGSITFGGIRQQALKIASAIGYDYKNKPIAVYLPKSHECVSSFMGILYTGNFYVPLDVKSPNDRLSSVINNLEPVIIITQTKYLENLKNNPSIKKSKLIELEALPSEEVKFNYKSILNNLVETDPIYSIYTSGSTGKPKGVLVSHSNVSDFVQWFQETYNINEQTIIGNQSPFLFDVSVIDIYMCLKYGAHMHIIPEKLFSFPIKLIEYINEKQINFIVWVPSVLISIANAKVFDKIKSKYIKQVLFAGEPMPNKQLNYWRKRMPGVQYSNMYGPTEGTVIASYYIVDREFRDSEPLPMGKQVSNAELVVLNMEGGLVKKNEVGELYIKGSSVAMGYWNNLKATEKSFIQNPLNTSYPEIVYKTGDLVYYNRFGELVFSGRVDSQIKHMGYRIELGEIENATLNIKDISGSCVLYNKIKSEIVLFYQTENSELSNIDIRTELIKFIPKYMLPTMTININNWPLNSNGKIDRKKLATDYLI